MRKKRHRTLPELFDPDSPGVIEVHRLLAVIKGKGRDAIKSLLVTSSMPREGKSILAAYLAMTWAYTGKRAIIMDMDLRRPVQHKLFGTERSPGIGEYLTANRPYEEFGGLIHTTPMENLLLVPSGAKLSSPGGVLRVSIEKVGELINRLSLLSDLLIIDTPPIVPVSDAELIGPLVDGVALVVLGGKTFREIVQRGIELIRRSNANLLGIVLNNVTKALPYYYEHEYYKYSYEAK